MTSKEETIRKVYYDPAGFGSIKNTLKDARKHDQTITEEDVKKWFKKQDFGQRKKARGMNSFVANAPKEEYQMDLFFFPEAPAKKQTALIMVDIFTKFTQIVLVASKQPPDILAGIMECMKKMGGKPKTIYADREGGWTANIVLKWFEDEDIRLLTTMGHAPVAERQIRTMKDMIYKRLEGTDKNWWEVVDQVLITYNYKMEHSVTRHTPGEARKPTNQVAVKFQLELKRRQSRKYPAIDVGNKVRIMRKKSHGKRTYKSLV